MYMNVDLKVSLYKLNFAVPNTLYILYVIFFFFWGGGKKERERGREILKNT